METEKTDTSSGKKLIGVMNVTLLRRSLELDAICFNDKAYERLTADPTSTETSTR